MAEDKNHGWELNHDKASSGYMILSGGSLATADDVISKVKELDPDIDYKFDNAGVKLISTKSRAYYAVYHDDWANAAEQALRKASRNKAARAYYTNLSAVSSINEDMFIPRLSRNPKARIIAPLTSLLLILISVITLLVTHNLGVMLALLLASIPIGAALRSLSGIKKRILPAKNGTIIRLYNLNSGLLLPLMKSYLNKLIRKYANVKKIVPERDGFVFVTDITCEDADWDVDEAIRHSQEDYDIVRTMRPATHDYSAEIAKYLEQVKKLRDSISSAEERTMNTNRISGIIDGKIRVMENNSASYDPKYYRDFIDKLESIKSNLESLDKDNEELRTSTSKSSDEPSQEKSL